MSLQKQTKNTGKQLFVASVVVFALFGVFSDKGAWQQPTTTTAQAGSVNEYAQVEYTTKPQQEDVGEVILEKLDDTKVIWEDDPTELPPEEANRELWIDTIDKYIQETNPNLNNTNCGDASGQIWVDAGIKYGNHPYFLVAIAQADTSLGRGLTNKCNLGNTGHCDSCASGHQYNSFANSIYSISQTLSNEYLGKGTLSCHYSVGGWDYCPEGKTINNGKFYASSKVNWNRNVNATLARLFGTTYKNNFKIKI